ncbi:MAG: BrxA family protein [Candidatus Sericytochromatia bacterium]
MLNRSYEVNVANHPYLLQETLACARILKDSGWEDFNQAALQDPVMQTLSPSTAQSYLRAIRHRLEEVPPKLLTFLASEDEATAQLTLLYILLQKNRLLRELVEEPIRDAVLDGEPQLPKQLFEDFFESKREASPILKEWSDTTWRKFWGNTLKALQISGLLHGQDPVDLVMQDIPKELQTWLKAQGEEISLQLLLDREAY